MCLKKQYVLLIVTTLLTLLMLSCDSTDSGGEEAEFEDGISRDIRELLGEDLLSVIENDLCVPVHRGDNPPDVVAAFSEQSAGEITISVDPLILFKTIVPDDFADPGDAFADLFASFSNQDFDDFTIVFDFRNGPENSEGPGSFIIGNNNSFTVFGPQVNVAGGDTVRTVNVFSATINGDTISSAHYAIFVIEGGGGQFIQDETGRSFQDGNDSSEVSGSRAVQNASPTRHRIESKLPHILEKVHHK